MQYSYYKAFCAIVALFLSFDAWNQQPSITPVIASDPKDFGGRINCFYQDKTGFIWIGKETGLFRYDGYQLKAYKNSTDPHSIGNDNIQCIAGDDSGNLWIGTKGGGLNRFNRLQENFIRYTSFGSGKRSVSYNEVFTVFADTPENLWIGTDGGGLDFFNTQSGEFTNYNQSNSGLKSNKILAIHKDKTGKLWLGTWDGGLHVLEPESGTITHIGGNKKFQGNRTAGDLNIFKILEKRPGILWLATWGQGLIEFNTREKTFREVIPAAKAAFFRDLKSDTRNNVWAASTLGLFLSQNDKPFELVNDPSALFANTSCIMFDRTDLVWVGSENGSVGKINPRPKNFRATHLQGLSISALSEGIAPDELFAAAGNKLYSIQMPSFRQQVFSIPYDDIVSVSFANGKIITASSGGLANQEGNFFRKAEIPDSSVTHRQIWTIARETDSTFWLGTLGAAFQLSRSFSGWRTIATYHTGTKNGLSPSHYPSCFLTDRKGNLWIGTFGGGLNFRGKGSGKFVAFRSSDTGSAISDNFVECLFEDRQGRIWAGTHNGLDCFNPNDSTFKRYNKSDGLQNTWIAAIEEDRKGNIWVSTHGGIACIHTGGTVRNYNTDDGLPSNYFMTRASASLSNGSIWFGSGKGLVWFYPDSISLNPYIPDAVITGFKVNNQNWPVSSPVRIRSSQSVSFQFAAMHYVNPAKNRYRYKLDGYEHEWQIAGDDRTAVYENLRPGRYIFKVVASNDDGTWSPNETTFNIIVSRAYPLIAIILPVTLLALISLWFFMKLRKRTGKKAVTEQKQKYRDVHPSEITTAPAEDVFLQKALRIVEENISDPNFGVDEMCYKICISRPQLYRKIHALTGLSVTEFIKEIRLKRAAQLLKQKQDNISEIAYSVGFNDPKYFSKCFKQKFGMSPARFIQQNERFLPPQ